MLTVTLKINPTWPCYLKSHRTCLSKKEHDFYTLIERHIYIYIYKHIHTNVYTYINVVTCHYLYSCVNDGREGGVLWTFGSWVI